VRIEHSFLTHSSFLIRKDPPPICNKYLPRIPNHSTHHPRLPRISKLPKYLINTNNLEEALHEDNTINILNALHKLTIVD